MNDKKLLLFFLSILISINGCTKSDKTKESNISNIDRNISKKSIKDINKTVPKDTVVSINGKYILKKDLPKEYNKLSYSEKKHFLSKYLYLKVALISLLDKEKEYQKEIKSELETRKTEAQKIGVHLDELQQILLNYNVIFDEIAYQEVLKKDKDIDKKVNEFYKKHEKEFSYPKTIEVSHISFRSKERAEKVLNELNQEKNITIDTFATFAKKYSEDLKTKFNGGYVGKIGKEQNKPFFDKLWKAEDNSLVKEIFEKDKYYHIIYVLKKHNAVKRTLKDERLNIIKFLLKDDIKKWKKETFKKSDKKTKVKVYDIKI